MIQEETKGAVDIKIDDPKLIAKFSEYEIKITQELVLEQLRSYLNRIERVRKICDEIDEKYGRRLEGHDFIRPPPDGEFSKWEFEDDEWELLNSNQDFVKEYFDKKDINLKFSTRDYDPYSGKYSTNPKITLRMRDYNDPQLAGLIFEF